MLLPAKKEDNKTLDILKQHIEIEKKLLSLFTNEELDIKELLEHVNELKELNDKDIEIIEPVLVQDKKLDEVLIKSYEEAKNEIFNIYMLLKKDETPVLNLDKIKSFLEEFSRLSEDNFEIENISINDKLVVLSNNEEKIPLRFKNGKKIILTKKLFDLSFFTHDELVEILRFLDLVITDNSYDYLRSEIAKQITSISSISSI